MKKMLMTASVPSMIGQFNMNNISILLDLGYEVHVGTNFKDCSYWPKERIKDFIKELKGSGVKYHQIDYSRSPKDIRAIVCSFMQVDRLLRKEKFEFVHCHTPMAGVVSRICCHRNGVKVIYTVHGFHFYKDAPIKNWLAYYPVEKVLSKWTDILITINKEDYKRAKQNFYAKETRYIPGVGVDTEKFAVCSIDKKKKREELKVPQDAFVLLSVGELDDRKNHRMVLNVLREIHNKNVFYLIVGDGKNREEYMELIYQYCLEDNIKLLGFRNDIDELCEMSDCFIHPSLREGLEMAFLEAMASGLPLISSDVNGIKDYTENGMTGICINPESENELKRAICKMIEDKQFCIKCGLYNQEKAKKFDVCKSGKFMEKEYKGRYRHLEYIIMRSEKRSELGVSDLEFLIVSVGELNNNKNHEVIIRAIAELKNKRIKYVICGEGERKEYLINLIKKLKLNCQVMLLGYRSDIKEILYASDCFAFPSKREGLGIAAIEAMTVGLPLITSNIGGIKDYMTIKKNGYMSNPSDVQSFKKSINKISSLLLMKAKMSNNSKDIASLFSIEKVQGIMDKVYGSIE